jgi:HEAT repeat protein
MINKSLFLLPIAISLCILSSCNSDTTPTRMPISGRSNVDLIRILEEHENYAFPGPEYSFEEIVLELEKRGTLASEAAPALAKAMAFNQRGSVIASRALIAMGSSAESSIPYLLQNLDSDREEVRRYSVFVLGILGEHANCAVPKISSLLWDKEPLVRSTSAGALTAITNIDLVEFDYLKLDPELPGSVNADDPEGKISKIAREWWLNSGQNQDWTNGGCELSN